MRISNKLEECTRVMKSVDKFIQSKAVQMARYERQISLLMKENNVLRKALKMPNRKKPPVKSSFSLHLSITFTTSGNETASG